MSHLVKYYIWLLIIGIGCLGIIFINFTDIRNTILYTYCSTIILLVLYLVVAILKNKKNPGKKKRTILVLFIVTILLNVLVLFTYQQMTFYFTQHPGVLRWWIITPLFFTALIISAITHRRLKSKS